VQVESAGCFSLEDGEFLFGDDLENVFLVVSEAFPNIFQRILHPLAFSITRQAVLQFSRIVFLGGNVVEDPAACGHQVVRPSIWQANVIEATHYLHLGETTNLPNEFLTLDTH
jgi:hypothetical protein